MPMVTVRVTADDITRGLVCCTYDDPIALALKRQYPGCTPIVGHGTLLLKLGPYWVYGKLPVSAQMFTRRFHTSLPVQPFQFSTAWERVGSTHIPVELLDIWLNGENGETWPRPVHHLRRRLADGL